MTNLHILRFSYSLISIALIICTSCSSDSGKNISTVAAKDDGREDISYLDISAVNPDGSVNMIIEISAGTTAKYEMNKKTHRIVMDSIGEKPRYINYLGYPGNYGMIPNTILPKSVGGDGDPLDVLLLGVTQPRGTVHKVRIVGVMNLLDNGEQDDKILAVPMTEKWSQVQSIEDLDHYFPGARVIVATFFTNYKAKGEMEFSGWGSREEAMKVVNIAYDYSSKE